MWIGAAATVDFQSLPQGVDLCRLDPNTALPANSANIYCTNRDGSDFPYRTLPSGPTQINLLQPGSAGQSNGGVHRGDVRLALSFDYALTANVLLGARVGVTLFKYQGQAAYTDGRAWSFASSRLYADARATFLLGDRAITKTVAPMGFAGLGAASFDTSTSAGVALSNGTSTGQSGTVNLWQTNGPFFLLLGLGIHVAMGDRVSGTLAVRGNGSFGANGFIPTVGPRGRAGGTDSGRKLGYAAGHVASDSDKSKPPRRRPSSDRLTRTQVLSPDAAEEARRRVREMIGAAEASEPARAGRCRVVTGPVRRASDAGDQRGRRAACVAGGRAGARGGLVARVARSGPADDRAEHARPTGARSPFDTLQPARRALDITVPMSGERRSARARSCARGWRSLRRRSAAGRPSSRRRARLSR